MKQKLLFYLSGAILIYLGSGLLFPAVFAYATGSEDWSVFSEAAIFILSIGIALWRLGQNHQSIITSRWGSAFLLLAWLLLSLGGALPYAMAGYLSFPDALWESISGFTTTGLTELVSPSPAFLLWRSLTQWLGGALMLIFLVSILPVVSGKFGLSLAGRHTIGFSQRIHHMFQLVYGVFTAYVTFTLLAAGLFYWCGLSVFDATNLALVTISTGGCYDFSRIQPELNLSIQLIMAGCMFLASSSFLLYWQAGHLRSIKHLWGNLETKAFLVILLTFGSLESGYLWVHHLYDGMDSLRYGFFHVLSFTSTTGITLGDIHGWPSFSYYLLFILLFVGGSIISTTGGIKLLRFIVLFKSASAEMRRTLHPRMVVTIHVAGNAVPMPISGNILTFFFMFIVCFLSGGILISLSGLSVMDSLALSIACLASTGPALEITEFAGGFASLPGWTKGLCAFLMILGRMEIFAFLVVLQGIFRVSSRNW
jgi:trk system potassium uptake protein TrkH